jgi:hypothetical protein
MNYGISESARAFASEAQATPQPLAAFIGRTATLFSSSLMATALLAAAIHHG